MIKKIISGSVFSTKLQEGEQKVFISCGTNTIGKNNPNMNSVAGQIARDYSPDFSNLGKAKIGEVHIADFDFMNQVNARAFGIVCNKVQGWSTQNDANWEEAVVGIRKGFERIAGLVSPEDTNDMYQASLGEIEKKAKEAGLDAMMEIQKYIDLYNARINPIVRTVLIGTGESGRNGDADVVGILDAMQSSPANLHLYLFNQQQAAQVAQVIPLYPRVRALAAVPGYDEILELRAA